MAILWKEFQRPCNTRCTINCACVLILLCTIVYVMSWEAETLLNIVKRSSLKQSSYFPWSPKSVPVVAGRIHYHFKTKCSENKHTLLGIFFNQEESRKAPESMVKAVLARLNQRSRPEGFNLNHSDLLLDKQLPWKVRATDVHIRSLLPFTFELIHVERARRIQGRQALAALVGTAEALVNE